MRSSKDVCRAVGVDVSFAAICFIHFKLIFILTDKLKLIIQCPDFELDPFGFNLSQPRMLKPCRTVYLRAGPYQDFYFRLDCKSTLGLFQTREGVCGGEQAYKTITTFHVYVYLSAQVPSFTTPSACFYSNTFCPYFCSQLLPRLRAISTSVHGLKIMLFF